MNDQLFDHHIKRSIVAKLVTVRSARYAELRPKNVESNLFMYHLQQLIKQGVINKTDVGYELTADGKQLTDRLSLDSLELRVQPKVITILTIQRSDKKWLLLKRTHQPFLDFNGFPSGKVHYGEKLHDSASRELKEKTGMSGIDLQLRGNFIMRFKKGDQIVNHIVGYVFSGVVEGLPESNISTEFFQSYWGDEPELFLENSFKGHAEILALLEKYSPDERFMSEHEFTSDF